MTEVERPRSAAVADASLHPLLSDKDVAKLLGIQPDTVRRWAARGDLPCVRLGRLLRFRAEDVAQWIALHATVSASPRVLRRRPGSIRAHG